MAIFCAYTLLNARVWETGLGGLCACESRINCVESPFCHGFMTYINDQLHLSPLDHMLLRSLNHTIIVYSPHSFPRTIIAHIGKGLGTEAKIFIFVIRESSSASKHTPEHTYVCHTLHMWSSATRAIAVHIHICIRAWQLRKSCVAGSVPPCAPVPQRLGRHVPPWPPSSDAYWCAFNPQVLNTCRETCLWIMLLYRLELLRAERENAMFPDEMDTPQDIPARVRFQKCIHNSLCTHTYA